MIGDRIFDVEGAKKAGVPCVAVTYGFGSESELASADFQADSVNSLEEVLFKTREVL
ncbi:HAD hydrolase-like protein [uncultured Dubosiella sp.]|nr:HAD hydrolase-like protein [uncultured Dubosiella sp.]